jgi:hypothetical protein
LLRKSCKSTSRYSLVASHGNFAPTELPAHASLLSPSPRGSRPGQGMSLESARVTGTLEHSIIKSYRSPSELESCHPLFSPEQTFALVALPGQGFPAPDPESIVTRRNKRQSNKPQAHTHAKAVPGLQPRR